MTTNGLRLDRLCPSPWEGLLARAARDDALRKLVTDLREAGVQLVWQRPRGGGLPCWRLAPPAYMGRTVDGWDFVGEVLARAPAPAVRSRLEEALESLPEPPQALAPLLAGRRR